MRAALTKRLPGRMDPAHGSDELVAHAHNEPTEGRVMATYEAQIQIHDDRDVPADEPADGELESPLGSRRTKLCASSGAAWTAGLCRR
jgi:hypothetical protein